MKVAELMYGTEAQSTASGLDLDYIDRVAEDIAAALAQGAAAEAAYQPGDGTRYGIVLTPLRGLVRARPRVSNGREWDSAAVHGMTAVPGGFYDEHGYLLSILEFWVYPIRLGDRGVLAASYIEEHWKMPLKSAVSVALLLRAVSARLDELATVTA